VQTFTPGGHLPEKSNVGGKEGPKRSHIGKKIGDETSSIKRRILPIKEIQQASRLDESSSIQAEVHV
jgi:hypothetical protein